jgi:hypothetical protein
MMSTSDDTLPDSPDEIRIPPVEEAFVYQNVAEKHDNTHTIRHPIHNITQPDTVTVSRAGSSKEDQHVHVPSARLGTPTVQPLAHAAVHSVADLPVSMPSSGPRTLGVDSGPTVLPSRPEPVSDAVEPFPGHNGKPGQPDRSQLGLTVPGPSTPDISGSLASIVTALQAVAKSNQRPQESPLMAPGPRQIEKSSNRWESFWQADSDDSSGPLASPSF